MNQESQQTINNPLAAWIAGAKEIKIQSLKLQSNIDITNNFTISDVKSILENQEGIPPNQQSLLAVTKNPCTLWLTRKYSNSLQDNCNIKELMQKYNTDTFQLYLKLPIAGKSEVD